MGALSAITRELASIEHLDAFEIRQRAVSAIAKASGGFGMYYSVGRDGNGVTRLAKGICSSPDPAGRFADLINAPVPRGAAPLQLPTRRDRQGFRTLADTMALDVAKKSELWRMWYAPNGFTENARLLVYRGHRFAGYVGAFSDVGAKTMRRVARELRPLVAPMQAALCVADALDPDRFDAGSGWMVTDHAGRVTMSCLNASSWLTDSRMDQIRVLARRADLGEALHGVIDAVELSGVRVDGEGKSSYVVSLTALEPVLLSAVATLTPAQREVAEFAAAGATAKEIGAVTHRSIETVRSHLRNIYRRLSVSTRVELAQALSPTAKNFDD